MRTTPTVLETFFEFATCRREDGMFALYWTTELVGNTLALRADDKTGTACIEKTEDGGFTVTFYLKKKVLKCLWMYEKFVGVPYRVTNSFVEELITQAIGRMASMIQ